MKTIFLFALLLTQQAFAQKILHEKTVTLPVEISADTVLLSNADYSSFMVKVVVPSLADVTFLNHRNRAAGGPCMATRGTMVPEDVIQGRPGTENVPFTIKLKKYASLDQEKKCQVVMVEEIQGKIRGFTFNHSQRQEVQERQAEDCR